MTESPKDGMQLEPEFLSFEDASAVLRLSTREIYRLVEEGELVVHEYKRRRLIDPDSVKRFADKIRAGEFASVVAA